MEALISGVISFLVFHLTSHPKSKFSQKIPSKKIKRIQVSPSIAVEAKNRVFHFHHWMIFTPLYFYSQHAGTSWLNSSLVHGFLLGAIIQGLLYADRFRFVFHVQEYKKFQPATYNLSFLRKLL